LKSRLHHRDTRPKSFGFPEHMQPLKAPSGYELGEQHMQQGATLPNILARLHLLEQDEQVPASEMIGLIADLRAVAVGGGPSMEGRASGFLALATELEFAAATFYDMDAGADRQNGAGACGKVR
jgi:hypothetical protein